MAVVKALVHVVVREAALGMLSIARSTRGGASTTQKMWTATALLITICAAPSVVAADNRNGDWYGWQTITADAASVGTIALGINRRFTPLAIAGAGGLILGAPILHAAHGNWGNAGLSLGSRVLFPLGGMLLGGVLSGGGSVTDGLAKTWGGGLLGFGAALVVDYAVISFDDGSATVAMPQARQWMLSLSAPL